MRMLCLLLFFWVAHTAAQELTIESKGYGSTVGEATANAKREALAQGIGQTLSSQTEVENFMVKRDFILSRTAGHVKSAQILEQTQGPDGAWEVRVRAIVSKGGLSKDLVALMALKESVGNPRIAMLVRETVMGNDDPTANRTEIQLADYFKARSFEVVDPNLSLRFRESPEAVQALGGDPAAAARLGSELNAEVIIIGTVVAKESDVSHIPAMAKSGMKSASAVISLKAINVGTRQIMAAKSADAPAAHINAHTAGNKAIENGVRKLMDSKDSFFESLVENWRMAANDGAVYQLTIQGVSAFSLVKSIRAALQGQVEKLEQRQYSRPVLSLDAVFAGPPGSLCEKLDGLTVDGKTLAVENCAGHAIVLNLQ